MSGNVVFSPALQAPIVLAPAASGLSLAGGGTPAADNATVTPDAGSLYPIGAAVRLAVSPIKLPPGAISLIGSPPNLQQLGAGFLPPGHFLPSIQPMVLVYPRPDAETSPNARHHWAFLDPNHPMLHDHPIDVIGGAYPHIPVLRNGPPGMTIVMPDYSVGPPYASPRIQWTPTVAWSGVVSVDWYSQEYPTDNTQIINQQWSLATSGDISTGGRFVVLSKDVGLPTGLGSWDQPLDDLPTVFGSSWGQAAILIHGVSVAGTICILLQSTAQYTLPLFTDGSTTQPHFQTQVQTKPMSIIGVPGQTLPKFSVAGAGGVAMGSDSKATGWFLSRLNPDGYNTLAQNFILMSVGGSGDNQITFDKITWSNSGWGNVSYVMATVSDGVTLGNSGTVLNVTQFLSGAPITVGSTISLTGNVNTTIPTIAAFGTGTGGVGTYTLSAAANIASPVKMALYYGRGNCVAFEAVQFQGLRQFIYCNDCTETNRQSGNPGNNGAGVDWFSCQYSLIQGWYFNDPNWRGDNGTFFKIDIPNSEIRGCYMLCGYCVQAFSFMYWSSMGNNFSYADSKHNVLVGANYMACPGNLTTGYGLLRIGRNNILSTSTNPSGLVRSANVGNGPYQIVDMAVQGPITTLPNTPYTVVSGNVIQASGLLLSDGSMDPTNPNYSANIGVIGAKIQ